MQFMDWLDLVLALAKAGEWRVFEDPDSHWKLKIYIENLTGAELILVKKLIDDKIAAPFDVQLQAMMPLDLDILKIINDPGMTWKVRRALLRAKGLTEEKINILIPEPPEGMDWHPSDY